ncbi:MAG: hypothetical protein NT069_33195 [Planctomycetota bacterium]|nr:hypothetical protein [Planctomycetota bacterium]
MSKEYLIRRQVFSLLNTNFYIYDEEEKLIGYSRQKAFKLKEDIRIFTDESMQDERLSIKARSIMDFSAAYDVYDSKTNKKLGALKRKGWASMLRDSWIVMDESDQEIGKIQEDSMLMATLRRFLSALIPQSFHLLDENENQIATFRQNFNPFVFKLNVTVEDDCPHSPLLVLAAGILLSAIEGRQR